MYPVPGQCPVCKETMEVTRVYCRHCDTAIEGHFSLGRFNRLTAEQLQFAEIFLYCEGKITRAQEELGVSYPTVRGRLNDLVRALGYDIESEPVGITPEERQSILDDLAQGNISSEEAVELLRGQ